MGSGRQGARGEGGAQRGTKWIGKMGSEIIVMKLARLPLSAFMGVLSKGSARALLRRAADCYWLIDVGRFFFVIFSLPDTALPLARRRWLRVKKFELTAVFSFHRLRRMKRTLRERR